MTRRACDCADGHDCPAVKSAVPLVVVLILMFGAAIAVIVLNPSS